MLRGWRTNRAGSLLLELIAFCVSLLLLLLPAFYNGFPLVFSDSGAYIIHSFQHVVPIDRPIVYSLFLCSDHLCMSHLGSPPLWVPIGLQAALFVYLVRELLVRVSPVPVAPAVVAVSAVLAAISSAPWFVSEVMPDVFAPLGVMALLVIVYDGWERRLVRSIPAAAILALAAAVHYSHPLVFALALVLLAPVCLFAVRSFPLRALLPAGTVVVLGAALIPFTNYAFGSGLYYSNETHMYLMARLTHDGLVQRELRDHCQAEHYLLCPYQSALQHATGDDYLFGKDSPVRSIGGWDGSRADSWRLIANSVRHYPLLHLEAAAHDVAVTAIAVRTGYGLDRYSSYYAINMAIRVFYPADYPRFLQSRQETGRLHLPVVNAIDVPAVALAALAVLGFAVLAARRGQDERLLVFDVGVAGAFAANALVTGLTSVPGADRYQSRIACLLVLAAVVHLLAVLGSPSRVDSVEEAERLLAVTSAGLPRT